MSSYGHLYVHLTKARDGFGAVILKNHLCILAIVHPPNFWTIFRVIPSAGWSFQLFAQSCNSNQPSTKPHKNGQLSKDTLPNKHLEGLSKVKPLSYDTGKLSTDEQK